jgi:hypothetical protein
MVLLIQSVPRVELLRISSSGVASSSQAEGARWYIDLLIALHIQLPIAFRISMIMLQLMNRNLCGPGLLIGWNRQVMYRSAIFFATIMDCRPWWLSMGSSFLVDYFSTQLFGPFALHHMLLVDWKKICSKLESLGAQIWFAFMK